MLINEKTWGFVRQHANDDVRKLALQGTKDAEVDLQTALQQIAGRQTARKKLPSWAEVEGVIYPPHLNMEQCSSEQTARYKVKIAGEGESMVDLTGGFGVDFYWISQGFRQRTYVEQNEQLCAIAQENFRRLGRSCCVCCCNTATYLMPHVSLAFLDPARRNEHGGRTYSIEDCTPNILELLPLLVQKADRILFKLSPMLDWRKAVSDLENASPNGVFKVAEVHIVSVDNECKELLLLLDKEQTDGLRVVCVNGASSFTFLPSVGMFSSQAGNNLFPVWEYLTDSDLADSPLNLYEPNASIMKAGCFAELEAQFPVQQISVNSHLFLSSDEINDFPGRKFKILSISSMNKQEIKKKFSESLVSMESANIAVRNFPMSAEQLRKEHKLFFCRKIG